MNWHSKRSVLIGLGAICLAMLIAGAVAAYLNRHHTLCRDGKPPVGFDCDDRRSGTTHDIDGS